MSGRALFLTGLVAFLVFAIVRVPASVVIPMLGTPAGIAYSGAEGTMWQGKLRQVTAMGQPLGDAAFSIAPLPLLLGAPEADIKLSGGNLQGGFRWKNDGGHEISNLDMMLDAKARLGRQGMSGALRLTGGSFLFTAGGRCLEGAGDMRSNILERGLGIEGLMLTGQLVCRDGQMQVMMGGTMQGLDIAIDGNIGGENAQPLSATLTPAAGADIPDELRQLLSRYSFTPRADGSLGAQFELDMFL